MNYILAPAYINRIPSFIKVQPTSVSGERKQDRKWNDLNRLTFIFL